MRLAIPFIFMLLLAGCAAYDAPENPESAGRTPSSDQYVSLLNATHEDIFLSEKNKTVDRISFIIQNDQSFDLDCDITVSLDNTTNSSMKRSQVGILSPGERKKVSLNIEMLYGKTALEILPDCRKT